MIAVIEEELAPLTAPECEGLWPILSAGLEKERDLRTSSMMALGAQLAQWLAARGASQALGGEPVHWRYAFAVSDAGTGLTVRRPSQWPRVSSESAHEVCEASTTARHNRRRSDRRMGERRSPTPLSVSGRRTFSMPRGAVRRAAAARLAVAACLGGGLLLLGLNHGPLAWLSPRPKAAFAEGAVMAEPFFAKPAPTDPLVQLPGANPAPPPAAEPALYDPQAKPAQPVLARTVRSPKAVEPAAPAPVVPAKTRASRHTPSSASAATPAPALRPASVLTVSPRAKVAQPSEPSEAELGLKNPW
jgi:hypothetical protein